MPVPKIRPLLSDPLQVRLTARDRTEVDRFARSRGESASTIVRELVSEALDARGSAPVPDAASASASDAAGGPGDA